MQQKPAFIAQILTLLTISWGLALSALSPNAFSAPLAHLESPSPQAFFRSGVGLIRGWSCEAGRVEISLDGGPLLATAHGTNRPDTLPTCGRTDTGFGLIQNWNNIGQGLHNLRAFVNGVEFANVNFTVATLGGGYLFGLTGSYTVPDFPTPGHSAKIIWSEPHQNFVFSNTTIAPPVPNPPTLPQAKLESPFQGAYESGIGLIRGWVCSASRIEIRIDNGAPIVAGYGISRPDTTSTCGHADTGFGLTHNWSDTEDGVHNLRAFADGVEFANVNFTVTAFGSEYLRDIYKKIQLLGFPGTVATPAAARANASAELVTTVQWSEADQNFIITDSTATGGKIAFVSAITDALNKIAVAGVGSGMDSAIGVQTRKNAQGQPVDVNALTWGDRQTPAWADLTLGADGLPNAYKDSSGNQARITQTATNSLTIQFVNAAGQAQGQPATIPVNGSFLQNLQQAIQQIRDAIVPTPATQRTDNALPVETGVNTAAAPLANLQFSLNRLLVRLFGSGSIAAGEVLCAIRTAANIAGTRNVVATNGCQSQLVADFLALANSPTAQAAADQSVLDQKLQQSLLLVQDVTEAPCAASADSAGCLFPAVAVLSEIATPERQIPPDSAVTKVQVPNVAGLDVSAATTILKDTGLIVGRITDEASTTIPVGNIISQNPAAGLSVPTGSAVHLVISAGPEPITVPNVVGQTDSAAANTLQSVGLTVGQTTPQYSATVPAGAIISQNPAAGTTVAPGSAVDLVVSLGPEPVTVPDVVGHTESDAANTLQNVGLTVGNVARQYDSYVPSGTIMHQNPAAGLSVPSGSAVDLVVSLGPELVTVPDVVGLDIQRAESVISQAGLAVGSVTYQYTRSYQLQNQVASQEPAAGAAVAPGASIDLTVYSTTVGAIAIIKDN